jgi:TM2 domain-containing membrane protein YozV
MKSLKQFFFIGLAISLILTSCTMEKRVYMSGYHVEWKKNKHNLDRQLASNENEKQNQIETLEQSKNEVNTIDQSSIINEDNFTASVGNSIVIPSRKIVALNKEENTVTAKAKSTSEVKVAAKMNKKSSEKINKKSAAQGGGKSQLIALLLAVFVGFIGIHRFYLGYIGIGVAQILTFGGCGIWSLIDLVRIVLGDLKPKGGSYEKTL